MIKYNYNVNFAVLDRRFFEETIQKLGYRRSESKFVSTLFPEKLNPFELT
jgi:hypothetical protein